MARRIGFRASVCAKIIENSERVVNVPSRDYRPRPILIELQLILRRLSFRFTPAGPVLVALSRFYSVLRAPSSLFNQKKICSDTNDRFLVFFSSLPCRWTLFPRLIPLPPTFYLTFPTIFFVRKLRVADVSVAQPKTREKKSRLNRFITQCARLLFLINPRGFSSLLESVECETLALAFFSRFLISR
jgi:hypothetical protein